jgi:hypothetical protein
MASQISMIRAQSSSFVSVACSVHGVVVLVSKICDPNSLSPPVTGKSGKNNPNQIIGTMLQKNSESSGKSTSNCSK